MAAPTNSDLMVAILDLQAAMMHGFQRVDVRFQGVETRLDRVEMRLDRVETRLDLVETRLTSVDGEVRGIRSCMDRSEKRRRKTE
jgi:hypothetical protein